MNGMFFLYVLYTLSISNRDLICKDTIVNSSMMLIDSTACSRWTSVAWPMITNDGRYVRYAVRDKLGKNQRLVICSAGGRWRIESDMVGPCLFSNDSKYAAWINNHDTLCVSRLGHDVVYVPGVTSFRLNDNAIVYESINSNRALSIFYFTSNSTHDIFLKERNLFGYGKKKNFLVTVNNSGITSLVWIRNKHKKVIWSGHRLESFVIDRQGNQIAFIDGESGNLVWYFRGGMDSAKVIYESVSGSFRVNRIRNFSRNGKDLYVALALSEDALAFNSINSDSGHLNIWSYIDKDLYPKQLYNISNPSYTAIIRLSDGKLIRLNEKYRGSRLIIPSIEDSVVLLGNRVLMPLREGSEDKVRRHSIWYLISLSKGEQKIIIDTYKELDVAVSQYGKYVVFFDRESKQYWTYETSTAMVRCITCGINEQWESDDMSYRRKIAAWGRDDAFVLIYGLFDIWQIDPSGINQPLNLTNGLGRRRNIVFAISLNEYFERGIRIRQSLILSAFNLETKENGFYKKIVGTHGDPDSLSMGPFVYDIPDNPSIPDGINFSPVRAREKEAYIVRRMSQTEAPNFYYTSDFRKFKQLSNISPQKGYNWYTTELHAWKSFNGRKLSGLLYKPENFDSSRKYPVIFYCYERKSDGLNVYLEPGVLDRGCSISISYYVSNGYLIFCPDIEYTVGDPMKGAYDAIVSGANYISGLSYVDSTKLGIQGCSWGGIEVNYLVSRTNLFAAACSSSGIANWVSGYNSMMGGGDSMQEMYEFGQFRIGTSLWDRPDIYLKNSAVFSISRLKTPLLLMHTRSDGVCRLSNIMELFTALRRLGKKVWMLVYDGDHTVVGNDAEDFGYRMLQFFNHYLKGDLAPMWMTRAVPFELQQVGNTFELDTVIKTPGVGLPIDNVQ